MALEIKTEILINATSEKIWKVLTNKVLTNFDVYPEWNPFIKSLTGSVSIGNKISVRIEPPGAKGMTFKPEIITYEENKELSWLGRLLLPGIFDGHHKFALQDHENGTTTFVHSEIFKGILVPLFKKQMIQNTIKGFEEMNIRLKEKVENC